jgi:hypothetical protein
MERVEMRDKTNRANPQSEAPTNPGKKSHKHLPSNKEMGSLGSAGPTGNPGPVGVSWQGNLSSGSVKIGKTDRKLKNWDTSFNDFF